MQNNEHVIFIHSDVVNKWMRLAGFPRSWPTYGADLIETVLHHYSIVPEKYLYRGFNPVTEMLSFGLPLYAEQRTPTRKDRIKQWIIKKLS